MLLTVEQLTKTFKHQTAVDQLSFSIKENECVALIGPNGSGKTTTLTMLAGLLTPTSGKISFLGKPSINRQELGYLPQYPAFYSWMTAREFLHFAGQLSNVPKNELKIKVEEMLSFVGLEMTKSKRIGGFSGGMKQRLGLAQALLHEPKLLILDEPVSALDPSGRRDVLQMMAQLKKKMAILYSTHVLHDAEQVSDNIIMLKSGALQWSGTLAALKEADHDPVYILSTEELLGNWLHDQPYVAGFELRSPTTAEISLRKQSDWNRLLEDCLRAKLTIIHFELKKQTLEDAYMGVMNG